MKSILTIAVAAAALAAFQAPPSQAGDRERQSDQKRVACSKPEACGVLSPADKRSISRAMTRNVLQSIDDRLRRERYSR
jgi:hypothetical protein